MKIIKSLAILGALSAGPALAGDIEIKISNIDAERGGVIHVLAFNDKTAFDNNMFAKMVGYVKIPASAADVTGVIKGQNAGQLAIMLHHDENDNGQFEMKGAIPLEGWGYSNGAGATEPPVFEDAAVEYSGEDTALELKMNYAE